MVAFMKKIFSLMPSRNMNTTDQNLLNVYLLKLSLTKVKSLVHFFPLSNKNMIMKYEKQLHFVPLPQLYTKSIKPKWQDVSNLEVTYSL